MATMSKVMLSESPDGDGILITTSAPIDGSDTLIHTAGSGTTNKDLVTLFAYNDDDVPQDLHLKWGDTAQSIKVTIPSRSGLSLLVADLPISDGNTIEGSTTPDGSVVTVYGYVNRITE
jgi:hypothetical protein